MEWMRKIRAKMHIEQKRDRPANDRGTVFSRIAGRAFDLKTRLARNETPHRIERKPSKRDIEWSRNSLLSDAQKYRLNSNEDEVWYKNHFKIDNTNLSPDEVADIAIGAFSLTPNDRPESEYRFGL